jgi:hypothetical protein
MEWSFAETTPVVAGESNGGKFEFSTSYHSYSRQLDHRMVVSKSVEHAALSGSKFFKPPALPVVTA